MSATTWWAVVESNLTTRGYIVRTTNSGQSWQDVYESPAGVGASAFLNGDIAWVAPGFLATANLPLYQTKDGGRSWQRVGTLPGSLCYLQFVDQLHGWCSSLGGAAGSMVVGLYLTSDGGSTWTLVSRTQPEPANSTPAALPFGCDKAITFTSLSVGWANSFCNGGDPYLYTTTDAGARWQPLAAVPLPPGAPSPQGAGLSVPAVEGNHLAVVETLDGQPITTVIATSSNGGQSWQSQLMPVSSGAWNVDLVDPTHWLLTNGTQLMSTDDAGVNWRTWTPPVPMEGDTLDFLTPLEGWAVPPGGNGGPFLWTINGGTTWTPFHIVAGPYSLPS